MQVYVITNTKNDKIYVGQHAGDDLDKYLQHNKRHAMSGLGNKLHLYRAMRKHGVESFSISPLVCNIEDKEQLDLWEKFFIKAFDSQKSGYNITGGGGGRLGVCRPHTKEEKIKIGLAHKGKPKSPEWSKKIGDAQRGRKFTDEHRSALRAGQIGKPKSIRSPEHCRKISENKKTMVGGKEGSKWKMNLKMEIRMPNS